MSTNQKFNEAKERLITSAQRLAGTYLLSKYGYAHITDDTKVELTSTQDPTSSSFVFNGTIKCYGADSLLNQVGVNMTVNDNDLEVTSEDVQGNITEALNAAEDHKDVVMASLDAFKLNDDGTKYLKVSHSDLQDANLGIVGKNEYAASPNKSELLQSIVKDAMLETPVTFTGEFKEPVIEKAASEPVFTEPTKKEAALVEEKEPVAKRSSWLTAELLKNADDDEIVEDECKTCKETQSQCKCAAVEVPTVSIKADVPLARMSDSMSQMTQLESQTVSAANEKVKEEAANALVALLHNMGYGTAKIAEVTDSKDGLDIMTAIDDAGSIKAVSIPVTIKDAKVILPKKSLVSVLVSKGLDVQAKLSEQFDIEVLEKLAAIEERAAYEAKEAEDILSERPVAKTAMESRNTMFLGDTDTLTVQKHLLPNHEDMKLHDKVSDGTDQWEIVNMEAQQNSKGEGDSSLWTLRKCKHPEADAKEPEVKIPS